MLGRSFGLFIFSSSLFVGCATATLDKENRLGFVEMKDSFVPEQVRQGTNSVFRMLVAPPRPFVLEKKDYDRFALTKLSSNSFLATYLRKNLEKCQSAGDIRCTFVFTSLCTAFLARANNELYTARHCFDENLTAAINEIPRDLKSGEARQKWVMENYSPKFLLFDRFGKMVADERGEVPSGDFKRLGSPSFFVPADPLDMSANFFLAIR